MTQGVQPPFGYIVPSKAVYTPAAPTAPASTSAYKMQGLAMLLTPLTPAPAILVNISAAIIATTGTAGTGINMQLWYGPVTSGVAPPANAAAIPNSATQLGTTSTFELATAATTVADLFMPVDLMGIAMNLTPGQQYWFDLACESIGTASGMGLSQINGVLAEIG